MMVPTDPEGSAQAKCSMARWDVGCWHFCMDRPCAEEAEA